MYFGRATTLVDASVKATPLVDASVKALLGESGSPITPDSYTMRLPSGQMPIMFDYIQNVGLLQLFQDCVSNPRRSFSNSITQCRHKWDVRRSALPPNSIIYWISPSNEATNSNMLYYLTAGGLRQVLQQVSTVIGDNINHLTVFQMTFIIVHSSEDLHFHTDFHPRLSGQAYTLLFPIQIVESSPPEVVIQERGSGNVHSFQYEKGHAFIWGTNTMHATATLNYPSGLFRICVSVSLGYITPSNVQLIIRDISQQYPPKREKFLLELASNAHWSRTNSGTVGYNLPETDDSVIYGKEWLEKLNEFLEVGRSRTSYPPKLQRWISQQRYAYNLKHGSTPKHLNTAMMKAIKTMTDSREQKLKDSNFSFYLARDEGRNQERWEMMFQKAQEHKEQHGTLSVSPYVDQQLSSWLFHQRKHLRDDAKLSSTGKLRKQKLLELGVNFK